MQQPPPGKNALQQHHPSTSSASSSSSAGAPQTATSKGQIHVKLIQARGLNVRSIHARPYVVVQFEQNEFVSRDPTAETDKEVKGTAINLSRNTSSTAVSALGAIGSKAAALASRKNSKGSSKDPSPSSSITSAKLPSILAAPVLSVPPPSASSSNGFFGRLSPHNPVWKHEVSFDVTSEESLITFNLYDRAVQDQGFLGTVQIKPVLLHDHTVDHWYKLRPYEDEVVSGEMRVQITYEQYKTKRALTPRDFEFLKLIGRGTFGKVFQVRKKDTKRIYAMKVLSKKEIVAKKEVAHTIGERKILQRSLESPFLVGLKFSFQTDTDLYLVTDFKSGGELFWHLQRETRFTEERAKFYIAELILALEHLHKYNIVYRDLKPENILLDATGHVALCDFGLSKADLRPDELTTTFCGTTEYLAPEILLDEHGYSKIVDFWSLGVLLFEMCCGWSPFYAEDTQQMYKNICFGKIRFPKGVINDDGKQFVKGLLNRNPKHRLGAQRDAAELKEHPFFKNIDWVALSLKQVTPPFKPVVESDESTNNFDPEFTSADMRDVGVVDMDLDDDDPSEAWVSQSIGGTGLTHTPNGPLGSERPKSTSPLGPLSPITNGTTISSNLAASSRPQGIQIKRQRNKVVASSPLTNSVQEKFRGFTYSGGESLIAPMVSAMAKKGADKDKDEEAVDDEETPEVTTEDEFEDYGRSAGRYANARKKGNGFSSHYDDDMS
ncbi:kinase-like domain-containing protein [Crassisporium funariophilum]|nr:kinase-like domain-containing protein [Crassisporium funariophilum]